MPDWTTFECPECGDVEDCDRAAASKFKCRRCGAEMDMIDGTEAVTAELDS